MKKKFKDTKFAKILKGVAEVAVDSLPFGTSALKVVKQVPKIWQDKNQDGKIQVNEINWPVIVAFVLVALSIRFDIIPKETLLEAAKVVLTLIGG